MLNNHKREFLGLLEMDPLFPVKFAYLLDRAFQNFVQDLGDYHDKDDPIRRAKKRLKGQQVRDIEAAMSGFKTGSLSQLFLPRTLRADPDSRTQNAMTDGGATGTGVPKKKPGKGQDARAGKGLDATKDKSPRVVEDWWTTNPSPEAAWTLPEGKSFKDFFDKSVESLKPNVVDWPKFKHHDPSVRGSKMKTLCLKYQCLGRCENKCSFAHADPGKMTDAAKKPLDDRFKLIFG